MAPSHEKQGGGVRRASDGLANIRKYQSHLEQIYYRTLKDQVFAFVLFLFSEELLSTFNSVQLDSSC